MEGDDIVINQENNQPAKKIKLEEGELKMEESEVSINSEGIATLPPLPKAVTSGKKDPAAEKMHIFSSLETLLRIKRKLIHQPNQ